MAKRRSKKSTTGAATEAAVMTQEPAATAVAEQPPFEPTGTYTPAEHEPDERPAADRGRFRTWTTDAERGYSKLIDRENRRIVLLFDAKPHDDVRTALKGAGFQYHPDYEGHKHAWTRYNDFEGRLQAEALETLIRELHPGTTSPKR